MLATRQFISIDCLTDTHRLSCRVPVTSPGLIAALNDPNRSLLDADDVYYSRLQQPAKIIAHYASASLSKTSLPLVVVTRREDLGPPGITRGGFSRLQSVAVMLTLGQFEVTGLVEVPKQYNAVELLLGGSARFMPVYQACAVPTHFPETSYTGGVILVNRPMVTLIASLPRDKD